MKAPLSWLRDFVDIDLSIPELARLVTMAGMEVESIQIVGLPMPPAGSVDARVSGLEWDPEKIVVASILEVMPHPNADRLVLCRLFDGQQEHVVLTGAPNLFDFKGAGPLVEPILVAYAREGARIFDGHQDGQVLTTLKRAKIRGVESYSMVCSEKELGISDEHEGIMMLAEQADPGTPLADLMGDAVLDVKLLPSYARCASILGLAREIAAMTGKKIKSVPEPIKGKAAPLGKKTGLSSSGDFATLKIANPELNPRFVLGLIRGVGIGPSPAKVQRRLRLAGMRPINNIVDATNYAMLEIGEPLHAFDHAVLVKRAGKKKVTILTRTAQAGEKLTTLDNMERTLDESTVLVCDKAGPLSIAGVMGGLESEISDQTADILLEGAAWNFINIRRTAKAQNLPSEASYRFSRGVHPSLAEAGVRRGLELMQAWAGGEAAPGLVDSYPLPRQDPVITLSAEDVERWLGIKIPVKDLISHLSRLGFECTKLQPGMISAQVPDHRMDIGEGISGKADLIEEIARIHGYQNIPETRISDLLPLQLTNHALEQEERIRDLLVDMGLTEIVSYRWTTPEREGLLEPVDGSDYLRIANPLAVEKSALRRSVLASVLDTCERNSRQRERVALYEIGPTFMASKTTDLPEEDHRLAIVLTGPRSLPGWQPADLTPMDFYDLKGMLTMLFEGLHVIGIRFLSHQHPSYHPGKCARMMVGEEQIGIMGELHPDVRARYDLPVTLKTAIQAAEIDLDALQGLIPILSTTLPLTTYPPVLEDLAVVVDETLSAEIVADMIRQTGGRVITEVRLFDLYRGEKIGAGRKSLAYRLTYQAPDKTLSDRDVAGIRARILKQLEKELGAVLRS